MNKLRVGEHDTIKLFRGERESQTQKGSEKNFYLFGRRVGVIGSDGEVRTQRDFRRRLRKRLSEKLLFERGLLIGIDDRKDRGISDRLPREIDG